MTMPNKKLFMLKFAYPGDQPDEIYISVQNVTIAKEKLLNKLKAEYPGQEPIGLYESVKKKDWKQHPL